MRRFLTVLAALGCLAGPVAGETDANDFDAAMAGLTKVMEAGADDEAIYIYLNETLQKARATGRINRISQFSMPCSPTMCAITN